MRSPLAQRLLRRTCLPILFASLLWAPAARAFQYEVEVDIENEQDLYDLNAQGAISKETLDTLVELLQDGVDLSTASRENLYALPGLGYNQVDAILEYRAANGAVEDPADLVSANVISAEELMQISPFLLIGGRRAGAPFSGKLRAMVSDGTGDSTAPPTFVQVEAKGPQDLSAGLVLNTTRAWPGTVGYDPQRDTLSAKAPGYQVQLPKVYLMWKVPQRQVIAGSFRASFGQRLTLDNTLRAAGEGFYVDEVMRIDPDLVSACKYSNASSEPGATLCSEAQTHSRATPDFSWPVGFRGVAGSVRDLKIGDKELALYGFASYQSRNIYQYEIFDRRTCSDPHSDSDKCKAPTVYVRGADPTLPAAALMYSTLPDLFRETAAGGNATLNLTPTSHLGLTGYWAYMYSTVSTMQLDFQEWSKYPFGGSFGALGLDGAMKLGKVNFFLEVTRSFDHMPQNGGGFGALERTTFALPGKSEVELSARYYDKKFVNPYGRPISFADEFEGQRARNEAGLRARWRGKPNEDFVLRAMADFSMWPEDNTAQISTNPGNPPPSNYTAGLANLDLEGRVDFVGLRYLKLAGWTRYVNKDLRHNGYGQCYEAYGSTNGVDFWGDPLPCAGEFMRVAGRAAVELLNGRLGTALQVNQEWLTDSHYPSSYRQDRVFWFELFGSPIKDVNLRWRTRFFDEAVDNPGYGETSLWSFLEASWRANAAFTSILRYDFINVLDQRSSTLSLDPNPVHRLRLELVANF